MLFRSGDHRDLHSFPTRRSSDLPWLSWGSGFATHTRNARYELDRDGDLQTRNDRTPLLTVDQQRFADGAGEVGFVNPVTEAFCSTCDRVRLTADGQFRTCLFSTWETDLRDPLRTGADDAEVERIIREASWRKEMKHHINDAVFQRASRSMSQIGG